MKLVAIAVILVACSSTKKPQDATPAPHSEPTPSVAQTAAQRVYLTGPSGEVPVTVEVVDTEPKIMKGLMYREHLPPDDGMLFMMPQEYDHAFYMRNTLIPLDMIFIAKDLTIAGIVENTEPKTETLRRVGKPSLYVLEVNAGWTAAKQIKAGSKVRFEGVTPTTPSP